MASTKQFPLHDNMLAGADTTLPAHLIQPNQWRTQHNIRNNPHLVQIPPKVFNGFFAQQVVLGETLRWMGVIPSTTQGAGKLLVLTSTHLYDYKKNVLATLSDDGQSRRWATTLYNGDLYYTNELNAIRRNNGTTDSVVSGAPAAKYLTHWFDHLVVGAPAGYPNRVLISDLEKFNNWTPDITNEADYYDFVEWQQVDYPFTGITGMGKIGSTLWIYTPTAIIPMNYVGLPKVFQVDESRIIPRTGNTLPWTLVCLNGGHFFFDHVEGMFFVFDGQQVQPIGEPMRGRMLDLLYGSNLTFVDHSRLFGYVDPDFREIWWILEGEDGEQTQATVFNYRYRTWFTASTENVTCFTRGCTLFTAIQDLVGTIADQTSTIGDLGSSDTVVPRLFGTSNGNIWREAGRGDPHSALEPQEPPTLETGDFAYGDIRSVKENDGMVVNAALVQYDNSQPNPTVDIYVSRRMFLGEESNFPATPTANWTGKEKDVLATYAAVAGRTLRYKFVLKNSTAGTFSAFSDGVYVKQAEK